MSDARTDARGVARWYVGTVNWPLVPVYVLLSGAFGLIGALVVIVTVEHGAAPETLDELVPYLQALMVLPKRWSSWEPNQANAGRTQNATTRARSSWVGRMSSGITRS